MSTLIELIKKDIQIIHSVRSDTLLKIMGPLIEYFNEEDRLSELIVVLDERKPTEILLNEIDKLRKKIEDDKYISELNLFAINYKDGFNLEFVPENLKTLCTIAVMQDGLALEFVPENLKTLCTIAVMQDGLALEFVPENLKTQELCTIGIYQMFLKNLKQKKSV
jgi:hypothetical protein